MPRRTRLSTAELHERWSNAEEQRRLSEFLDLREFLLHCVIRADYTISDALNSAVLLSSYGDWLQRELGKKRVPTKEARLICFLEFFHLDVLVDLDRMEPVRLADAIGEELLKGRIQLPFVHGPDLYLKACDLFPDERYRLGNLDTTKLLEDMPIGVFHLGHWLSGPYGLLQSRERRSIPPTLSVPLQHCHDVACRRVHRVHLETEHTAGVIEHQSAARKVLESEGLEASDFAIFFGDVFRDDKGRFNDFSTGTMPLFLGDCLSVEELRLLLIDLVMKDQTLRKPLASHGLTGDVADFVKTLNRAQALQLALIATDASIAYSLDDLVTRAAIKVPSNEVRSPVLFAGAGSGAFGAQVRMSQNGMQVSAHADIGPLRLRRLIDQIYASEDVNEAEELGWQLRRVPGVNLQAQLDEFLRTASPREVVDGLILTRKRHTEIAASELGVDLSLAAKMTRENLVDRILWKLGFSVNDPERLHDRFWQLHDELTQSARSATVSTTVNEEAMRGLSANYFEQLEMILGDSLAFASWVLTSDHVTAERPFHYDDEVCRATGMNTLAKSAANIDGPSKSPLEFGDRTTLHGLCRGFDILAKHLRATRESESLHDRDAKQFPRFAEQTSLKRFPLIHTVPFLDLVPSSQAEILDALVEVSAALVRADVAGVRNSQIHYRRAVSDLRPLIESLEATRAAVRKLEDLGFIRILFTHSRIETDQWCRTTVFLTDGRGREVVLGLPSEYSWVNLPSVDQPQYLVVAAQFAEPNEVLRITVGVPSDFTRMWTGFPARRIDSGYVRRPDADESESAGAPQTRVASNSN